MSRAPAEIAHLNLAREFRGGERQTLLLAECLGSRGWTQRLVTRRDSELADRVDALRVPGLQVVRIGRNPFSWIAATRNCRITHAHEARAVYLGLAAHWCNGTAGVITRRVPHPMKPSWLRDRAYRAAGAIVTVSDAIGASVQQRYPDLATSTIHSAHARLPVDEATSAGIRNRYAGRFLIGHTGSYMDRIKGQMTIIDVARRAATEHPDWHFLLMGAGEDETRFRDAIGTLGNIELTGFVDNLGDYLAACDLFVFPSRFEGLGSSLLDALQFGLPIVATRVGGIPELIEDGVNGILIEPGDPDQLYAGIRQLAQGGSAVERMRDANRRKAEAFSAERLTDAYEAVYRQLAGAAAALPT